MLRKIINKLKVYDRCCICRKKYLKIRMVTFANKFYCSKEGMSKHFSGLTTIELLEFHKKDRANSK